jgi:streptogramin lyase
LLPAAAQPPNNQVMRNSSSRPRLLATIIAGLALMLAASPAGASVVQPKGGLTSGSEGMALGADGNFWIAEGFAGTVARMKPDGTILGHYEVGAHPTTVTAGPGGKIWVAVTGAGKLAVFDTASAAPAATPISTAAAGCGPAALVDGGDGRMYFSMPNDSSSSVVCPGATPSRIGTIAADGTGAITTVAGVGSVFDLAVSSGKLFAPDLDGGNIRRISLGASPAIEANITAPVGSGPDGITADGNGRLWVTEFNTGGVLTFLPTDSSAVEILPPGSPLTNPFGIVQGADGMIHVTSDDPGHARLASIDPVSRAFTISSLGNTTPWTVVAGPDADLWIADRGNLQVLRFVNGAPRASITAATVLAFNATNVQASVDPRGNATTVSFDFGPSAAYGSTVGPIFVDAGGDPIPLGGAITGLTESTTYHVRIRATNSLGTVTGPDLTFTTPAAPVPTALPMVGATAKFSTETSGSKTIVKSVALKGLTGGETVKITCAGKGCKFKSKSYRKIKAKKGKITYAKKLFKDAKLSANAKVTVLITKPSTIGASFSVKARKNKKALTSSGCLAPGTTKAATCPGMFS